MSTSNYTRYGRLHSLLTLFNNGTDSQDVPSENTPLVFRVFNWPALQVHCQRLLYFVVFYALLAAFFFCYMSWLMYFQVSRDYPTVTGAHSALGMNPGLSFVPNPDIFNSLIRIRPRIPLPIYALNDQITDNTGCLEREDCVKEGGLTQDPERPCFYDVNAGGPCNMINGFGYDTAQPCFALKMNQVYGWLPEPVDGADGVLVRCEGYDENDTNNLGFSAIPPGKNPGKLGNGTFRSMRYTLIRVRCYLIARNIHVDFEHGKGTVSFELLVE
ncbi:unnamed protein product [Schistocephalus solidus]|uniref:Sodium/potassium-transporting ATPase subunit beta n=1 Tax=Schistocephalus solidus TaxID=70667 RepID=A0A183TI55_SCHSO|nr:unnamed protein product [Schistocephalus solidus]